MGCVSAVKAAGIRRSKGPVGLEAAHPQDWKVGAAGSSAHGPCTGLLRYPPHSVEVGFLRGSIHQRPKQRGFQTYESQRPVLTYYVWDPVTKIAGIEASWSWYHSHILSLFI